MVDDSEWKGVGGSVCRLSCHLAIAIKESHENHVRIVGCQSFATKRGVGGHCGPQKNTTINVTIIKSVEILT